MCASVGSEEGLDMLVLNDVKHLCAAKPGQAGVDLMDNDVA